MSGDYSRPEATQQAKSSQKRKDDMSLRAAGRLLSRAVIVGGAGVAAAATGYLGFTKADNPPSQLPGKRKGLPAALGRATQRKHEVSTEN